MGRYLCDKVGEQLQQTEGVVVKDITASSWSFSFKSARASLRVLPGCCGILLFHNISGAKKDPLTLLKTACKAAAKAGFGMVLISLRSDSELRKLLGPEWTSVSFTNPRTTNKVEVLCYALPQKVKKVRPQNNHED